MSKSSNSANSISTPEVEQLEMLAQVDDLIARLTQWSSQHSDWEPIKGCQALIHRLLSRVEKLKIRLEAPLVVATFGGTGTGKSSLVNALIGQECTRSGRERPTTMRPVLLSHPQTDLSAAGLPLEEFEVVRCDAEILRDILIIDCPDPDTSEIESPGSNLERLHQLLPHCDVLVYTSTQQKYRSARVGDELGQAATGCRLLFVQTHAELDEDIREDWRQQLSEEYEVPEVFFVDSLRGLAEQQAGQRPSGDLGRLLDVLSTQLGTSQRIQIRRSNLVDLVQVTVEYCRSQLGESHPAIVKLQSVLDEQRHRLTTIMATQLKDELLVSQNLWERRLLSSVTDIWGLSPFSSMMRLYNGIGALIASASMFRARSSAQMALIGAMQGARWLSSRNSEREAESQLKRISSFGLDDTLLRESQLVVTGYVQEAGLDSALVEDRSLDALRSEASKVEGRFLDDAGRSMDDIINQLARKNSGIFVRSWYELLFLAYVGYVLYRVGWNFFYVSFFNETEILTVDFYVTAGVVFMIWSGLLVMSFTRRLRRGLNKQVESAAQELAESRLSHGLFPQLDQCCSEIDSQLSRLDALCQLASGLRNRIANASGLGSKIIASEESIRIPDEKPV